MTTSNINRDAQLSTLANAAYMETPPKTISTSEGTWTYVTDSSSMSTNSGFFGVAYRNAQTGEIAIAYRGTDGMNDLNTNTTFATGGWSRQFTDAAKFTADVRAKTIGDGSEFPGAKLLVTGHSLGDGIGQVMGKMFNLDGAGFEGPGAARVVQNPEYAEVKAQYAPDTKGEIGSYTTYRASGSAVSGIGTHLGQVQNMVNLSEGGALGFVGAAIGIVGLSTGGVGGVILGALGLTGSNIASSHGMDGMERSMYVRAGLENALESGSLTMSYAPQSTVTGQPWTGEGAEPQVIVFKNSNNQIAAYVEKQGDGWTVSTPDQSTKITLTPAKSVGEAPQCVVTQAGKETYGCVLAEGNGTLTRKIDNGVNGSTDQITEVQPNGLSVTQTFDAQGRPLVRTESQTFDDGSVVECKREGGKNYIRAKDEDGNEGEWREYKTATEIARETYYENQLYSDMAGFLNALRGKDKLNQVLYGAKIAIDYQMKNGATEIKLGDLDLGKTVAGLSATVGIVAGLHALRSDDMQTQISGVVGLLGSANNLLISQ